MKDVLMKKEVERYLCKSKLKNINIFYKEYRPLYNKKKLPLLTSSNTANFFTKRKKGKIEPITTRPPDAQFQSLKIIKDKLLLNLNKNIKLKSHNNYNTIKSPNKRLNLNHIKSFYLETDKNHSNCLINFYEYFEKEIFSNEIYSNLEYNQNEIYANKDIYKNLIEENINYLKKNKNENKRVKFEKVFYYGKQHNKEMNLSFETLKISFKNMSSPPEIQEKDKIIIFPFELLPIFYYKGIESFIKFLSSVIKIENNFEKIYFEEDKIAEALNNIKDFMSPEEELNDSKDDSNNSLEFENNFMEKFIKETPIDVKPPILQKNNEFLKFNNFIFFWVTNNTTMIVTVTLPCISLNLLENKIVINQYITYELLFYLYKNNFIHWEYYILKYLSSYTKFRYIFQQIGSHSKIFNQTIFLTEPKALVNNFGQDNLVNVYSDHSGKNRILTFKSFYITANLLDMNYHYEKIYNIYFNFFHYVKLYEISKYTSKILFLIRFLELNKEKHSLSFDYKSFDEFNANAWLGDIKICTNEKFNYDAQSEDLYTEIDSFPKKIKIKFIRPRWSIVKFEGKKENIKTWEIGQELEKELIDCILNSGSDSWTNLLNECLKKLDEPVHILPSVTKKKLKLKKRNTKVFIYQSESEKRIRKRFSKNIQ